VTAALPVPAFGAPGPASLFGGAGSIAASQLKPYRQERPDGIETQSSWQGNLSSTNTAAS
jgi:hypothetical protein